MPTVLSGSRCCFSRQTAVVDLCSSLVTWGRLLGCSSTAGTSLWGWAAVCGAAWGVMAATAAREELAVDAVSLAVAGLAVMGAGHGPLKIQSICVSFCVCVWSLRLLLWWKMLSYNAMG